MTDYYVWFSRKQFKVIKATGANRHEAVLSAQKEVMAENASPGDGTCWVSREVVQYNSNGTIKERYEL